MQIQTKCGGFGISNIDEIPVDRRCGTKIERPAVVVVEAPVAPVAPVSGGSSGEDKGKQNVYTFISI